VPELNGIAIYASDGHYEKAAAHTPAIDGDVQHQGCFYSTNLRTHSMGLLDIARPVIKKQHDMHAYSLLLMLERLIGESEGICDEKVETKRAARRTLAESVIEKAGRKPNTVPHPENH
jgi:hypothetical protein